jgi:3-deoxy-D-manno-octulosonic-acid transferase
MGILYRFFTLLLGIGSRLASPFNQKAKAFVSGRKDLFSKLADSFRHETSPVIWVHCASLGEFEQGRPLIEAFKKEFPAHKILLTFFSPSGYEVRKNYNQADFIYYLPLDTAQHAQQFVAITKPVLAVYVKYEFWHFYAQELRKKQIPLLSVSTIFRDDQIYFKSYGTFYRNILRNFTYFFAQNDKSVNLLKSIGIQNVQRVGDTRFDRVYQIVTQAEEIPVARQFKADQKLFVVGSSWAEDIEVLAPFINDDRMKFIIAPHEISETTLADIERQLTVRTIRYSQAAGKNLEDYSVLLIDNIGMLSRLYRYGEFAYIGGAFGKGLHNILEAACYGVPILFGNQQYEKFQEAVDLINLGGAFEVGSYVDLKTKYEMLNIPENFLLACEVTRQYVQENLGATEKIMQYCRKNLNLTRP